MNLHGDFAGPEIRRYLFIEHPGNHQAHDLTLACGQRLVELSEFSNLSPLLACLPVTIQSLIDSIQQVLVAERLGQELYGPRFHGPHRHGYIAIAGDEDYRNRDTRVSQLALKVQAI